jgi:copper chaperone
MEKIKLQVAGMTCGGCVKSIQNALSNRDGVNEATADLDSATVTVEFDASVIAEAAIRNAIEAAGFDVAA